MLKAYIAMVAILFGALSLGLYYNGKLAAAKLETAEQQVQVVTDELRNSAELVAKLRTTAERLSKSHMQAQKQLQEAEISYAQAQRKITELHKNPEFSAWANADIPDDADNWLRQLGSTNKNSTDREPVATAADTTNRNNRNTKSARP